MFKNHLKDQNGFSKTHFKAAAKKDERSRNIKKELNLEDMNLRERKEH